MGTNEAANVAAGSNHGIRGERIDLLMEAAAGKPVLWLTVKSMRTEGPYGNKGMRGWNDALLKACATYSNLRVYDWATEGQDDWFQDDGTHFTSDGYAERGRRTAHALARAFPAKGRPAACVVGSQ